MTARITTSVLFGTLVASFASAVLLSAGSALASTSGAYYERPSCTVTLTHNAPVNGYPASAKLSWHSNSATTAFLAPDNVSVPLHDTRTVYPQGSTRYAITVSNRAGSSVCETWSTGMQPDSIHSLYSTLPIGTYVEISQLPYTGFDFGPLGNALYFSVLALIAVSAAYAALYTLPRHSMSIALMRQHRAFAQAFQRFIQLISR